MNSAKLSRIIIGLMIKPCLMIASMLSLTAYAGGDQLNIGLNFNYTNCNNGLGSDIRPGISFYKGKDNITIGLNIQKRNLNRAGWYGTFEHSFNSSGTRRAELFVMGSIAYQQAAFLSKRYVQLESYACRENHIDFSTMRLNLAEVYGGFGVHLKLSPHLFATSAVGVGVYHTLQAPDACKNMIRDNSAASIFLKCGLAWTVKRQAGYTGK